MGLDGDTAWGIRDLIAGLVYTGEEENLGQEEAHAEVQVEVGVVVSDGATQQEGDDGHGETHQRDDHAHVANDVQGELHLSGKRYTVGVREGPTYPPGRKKNYPDSWLGYIELGGLSSLWHSAWTRYCSSLFFGIHQYPFSPLSYAPFQEGRTFMNDISHNLLGLRSWMSFRFSSEMYAWRFWKAGWRQRPAFCRQEWAVAGPHLPTIRPLIFNFVDVGWNDSCNFWPLDYGCRGVILKPKSKWQPPDFKSSIPSCDSVSIQVPVLNTFLLEIPWAVPVSCSEPGLIIGVQRCPNFWE